MIYTWLNYLKRDTLISRSVLKLYKTLEQQVSNLIRYASLFFIIGTTPDENELIGLEIIHRYLDLEVLILKVI